MREPFAGDVIDHLLYGAPDLEIGMDAVERLLGARPVPGGRHPAYGTRNALLSLGPACYLEVISPDPGLPTPDRGLGFGIEGTTSPRLLTWAMRSREIETAAERAGLGPVEDGSRERADGTVLRWRLTDPYAERMDGVLPFLIDWGETPHPAEAAPRAGRLIELRIEHPAPDGVRRALATLGCRDVTVRLGAAPRLVAVVRTAGAGTAGATVELA
ncbi:MAG TPA: VOC family protein [Gemmatimonadota bacterium]|nr:VOC family protein [Gemmatimonadota bacterium]